MVPDRELLELLACPACRQPVRPAVEGAAVVCVNCGRRFPIEGRTVNLLLKPSRATDEAPAP